MTELSDTFHRSDITLYPRPGCFSCARLRCHLRRPKLPVAESNIWENPAEAAIE